MTTMNIHEILKMLPHRFPFLLVDRVLEFKSGESIRAIKNVSCNEPFFQGHFPHRPVMPGVLVIEALAQATGLLAFRAVDYAPVSNDVFYLVGIDKARFKQPVEPGDQLLLEVDLLRHRRGIYFFKARASVDGKMVASAELMTTKPDLPA